MKFLISFLLCIVFFNGLGQSNKKDEYFRKFLLENKIITNLDTILIVNENYCKSCVNHIQNVLKPKYYEYFVISTSTIIEYIVPKEFFVIDKEIISRKVFAQGAAIKIYLKNGVYQFDIFNTSNILNFK